MTNSPSRKICARALAMSARLTAHAIGFAAARAMLSSSGLTGMFGQRAYRCDHRFGAADRPQVFGGGGGCL